MLVIRSIGGLRGGMPSLMQNHNNDKNRTLVVFSDWEVSNFPVDW